MIKVNEKGEIDNLKKNSDSNVLTDGPISRINFCTIPERKIGAEMPVYGEFDDDAEKLVNRHYIEKKSLRREQMPTEQTEIKAERCSVFSYSVLRSYYIVQTDST